jgi:hypothetical protein
MPHHRALSTLLLIVYDGAGTGTMELTVDKKDGAIGGKVSAATDGGSYTADLKDVTFDAAKMSAKYDFRLDPSGEAFVTATFETAPPKARGRARPGAM